MRPELGNVVETAIAETLMRASEAGRWDVVAQLSAELQARRRAREGHESGAKVVSLDTAKRVRE